MWRTNSVEALEANGFEVGRRNVIADAIADVAADVMTVIGASGDLEARRDTVRSTQRARMGAIDAIERRPDLSSLASAETVTGTRSEDGPLHRLSEDHVDGEEMKEDEVKGSQSALEPSPTFPGGTESPADRVADSKNFICGCPESCAVPSASCMRPRRSS